MMEADLLAGREGGRLGARVELEHARARQELDAVLAPPGRGMQQALLARLLALEVALRAGRAVVGRVELAADEEDRAVEALVAQRLSGGRRGDSAAYEQDVDDAIGHARAP